jgi:serine/threonine protein kinase
MAATGRPACLPLPRSSSLEADYTLGKVLGKGAFGVVRLVLEKRTGELFACKSISKAKLISKACGGLLWAGGRSVVATLAQHGALCCSGSQPASQQASQSCVKQAGLWLTC